MLHDFIAENRAVIMSRTAERLRSRPAALLATAESEHGVPLFLTQLSETLRVVQTAQPFPDSDIGQAAARNGGDLLRSGFSASDVVHSYGDVCQAITTLAAEQQVCISTGEFRTLNACLDMAIAGAVSEHARVTAQVRSADEIERLGHAAHELRDVLNSALLAFHSLKQSAAAIDGSTGAVLARSLMSLRDIIDRTLSEVRVATGKQRPLRLAVAAFIAEIAATGLLHSEYRHIHFTVAAVNAELSIVADPQLLSSAVMNLLHNAFKNTPQGGHVVLSARGHNGRLLIEIEDECGGIPSGNTDLFQVWGDRRGSDRSGLGMGLSIARKAVRAQGGEILIRNTPGKGCVFIVDLPLEEMEASQLRA